jgi:hypothetical protein
MTDLIDPDAVRTFRPEETYPLRPAKLDWLTLFFDGSAEPPYRFWYHIVAIARPGEFVVSGMAPKDAGVYRVVVANGSGKPHEFTTEECWWELSLGRLATPVNGPIVADLTVQTFLKNSDARPSAAQFRQMPSQYRRIRLMTPEWADERLQA